MVWQVVGEALGMAMAALINTFNFPLYLLSGGMLPAWEFFAPSHDAGGDAAILHLSCDCE